MLLPDEKVGVFVVSNRLTLLSRVVALRALDEALELESIDWSSRLKERIDAAIEGGKEAKASHRRVAGAGLLRDLAEYEGEYEHPGYGRIKIEVHEDRLKPSFGELSLELTHRHFDVFELELKELSEETSWPLTFTTAPDGEVEGLTIPFEPTLEAIRFVRQADELSRDPEVLHRLAGPYEMGPIKSVVELKDSTVTLTVAGQSPVELVPQRGLRFGVKGSPSTSVEFFLQGADVEKLVIEPGGVFRPSPGD
jgi:hypothetical protein